MLELPIFGILPDRRSDSVKVVCWHCRGANAERRHYLHQQPMHQPLCRSPHLQRSLFVSQLAQISFLTTERSGL